MPRDGLAEVGLLAQECLSATLARRYADRLRATVRRRHEKGRRGSDLWHFTANYPHQHEAAPARCETSRYDGRRAYGPSTSAGRPCTELQRSCERQVGPAGRLDGIRAYGSTMPAHRTSVKFVSVRDWSDLLIKEVGTTVVGLTALPRLSTAPARPASGLMVLHKFTPA